MIIACLILALAFAASCAMAVGKGEFTLKAAKFGAGLYLFSCK